MTALFVQRDPSYTQAIRRVRYAVSKDEWDQKPRRPAIIARILTEAASALRVDREELICPAPVILEQDATTGEITRAFDYPSRPNIKVPGRRYIRTTYANYAEELPHLDLTPQPKPELDRETLMTLANANSALRERLMEVLVTGAPSEATPRVVDSSDLIDLGLRVIVRRPDYTVLVSKQTENTGKLVTSDGVIDE